MQIFEDATHRSMRSVISSANNGFCPPLSKVLTVNNETGLLLSGILLSSIDPEFYETTSLSDSLSSGKRRVEGT